MTGPERPRDSQRARLYRAEGQVDPGRRLPTVERMQAWVDALERFGLDTDVARERVAQDEDHQNLQGEHRSEAAHHDVVQALVGHAEQEREADGEDAAEDDGRPQDRDRSLLGGILTVGFSLLFGVSNERLHYVMVGGFAAVLALQILVILVLSFPFSGDIRVEPQAFEDVVRDFGG